MRDRDTDPEWEGHHAGPPPAEQPTPVDWQDADVDRDEQAGDD
ncbi:hypothetical protein GCM10009737_08420 [Nocardioides lentus]|uniref:Uncharacterized protein n=1 Tax=Nocardioides lentus TaxID=338077 RepID=A0ABP5ABI4_9ACTN